MYIFFLSKLVIFLGIVFFIKLVNSLSFIFLFLNFINSLMIFNKKKRKKKYINYNYIY